MISFTGPANNAVVDATSATATGTVTGNGLLPNMLLGVDHQRLPGDQVPPDLWSVPLAGSGNNRIFSQTVRLPLGSVAIHATEDNTGGKEGTATLSLFNLPPTLRDPGGALGPIQGVLDASPGCRIAVYQSGALATDSQLSSQRSYLSETLLSRLASSRSLNSILVLAGGDLHGVDVVQDK